MIDIDLLRNEKTREATIQALAKRGVNRTVLEELTLYDAEWRKLNEEFEQARAQVNETSKHIATAPEQERTTLIEQMRLAKEHNEESSQMLTQAEATLNEHWKKIPNVPFQDVQEGGEDAAQEIARSATQLPDASQTPKTYMELMGSRIDMERGAKVSGARFTYLSGDLARLELGIASYIMDTLSSEGFTQVIPPVLLGAEAMAGMGYLDQAGDEVYKTQDDLYLVGTSEQSLGAMHMNEMLPLESLPLRYMAFTPCFRREAGSHGKDVKGILRLHQFDKLEMFSITTPEHSEEEHQFLLSKQQVIMDAFALPYRVVRLAAGDLGAPSAKTYDIETWIPSEGKYRETHSTSNTTDYQSRRLNIRYKTTDGKTRKVHMLNGTAVALSRLLIALIENHQQEDGSVALPECLHSYLPFKTLAPAVQ